MQNLHPRPFSLPKLLRIPAGYWMAQGARASVIDDSTFFSFEQIFSIFLRVFKKLKNLDLVKKKLFPNFHCSFPFL
jgi:hypothetical protein